MKDVPWWQPEKLFATCKNYDKEWFRANLMKEDDKDSFGDTNNFYPNEKFMLLISLSKDIPFEDVKWL